MMIKKFVDWFIATNKEEKIIEDHVDRFVESKFSLLDLIQSLQTRVEHLEEKYNCALADICRLEQENIETTNALYEFENRVLTRIDAHLPSTQDWNKYSL
jgi:hypothetical protein